MDHYFSNNPDVESKPKDIHVFFNSHEFTFKTDNGVFCKDYLDEGTNAFLKVLIKRDLSGRNLDVGCGYGPIGAILGFFCPHSEFIMLDVNTRACALASANVRALGLNNCQVIESDIYEKVTGTFDNILINPPIRAGKKVIYKMYQDSYPLLNPQGSLYIVIRKSHGAESSQKFIESVYGNCTLLKRDKGYYIYQAIRNESETTNQNNKKGDLQ